MKKTLWLSLIGSVVLSFSVRAQGTFIFDQQSSTNDSGLAVGIRFQDGQPFGESFVPSLPSIDFVRLFMYPGGPESPDATVYVNLLSDSITGPTLASTAPISMHNYFSGYTNFYFSSAVSLVSGTTYYLQPVASAGDPLTSIGAGYTYLNGSLFISGVQQSAEQLWFREGVVVPEPSTIALAALGLTALVTFRYRRQQVTAGWSKQ